MRRDAPLWISLGGFGLTLTASYVNAVGFLGALQHGVTHITVQATRVGIELAQGYVGGAWHAGGILLCFFAGAVPSGAINRRPELSVHGRRSGRHHRQRSRARRQPRRHVGRPRCARTPTCTTS
jgi:hypothetical protein